MKSVAILFAVSVVSLSTSAMADELQSLSLDAPAPVHNMHRIPVSQPIAIVGSPIAVNPAPQPIGPEPVGPVSGQPIISQPITISSPGKICPAWGCNGPEPIVGRFNGGGVSELQSAPVATSRGTAAVNDSYQMGAQLRAAPGVAAEDSTSQSSGFTAQ